MVVIDASKGYLTEISTGFGRHYSCFQALEARLKNAPPRNYRALIIGPGMESTLVTPAHFTRTYQPFELANVFRLAGISSYEIEVVDINPDVIQEMAKVPTRLMIRRNFWKHIHHYEEEEEDASNSRRYYSTFFSGCSVNDTAGFKVVEMPSDVASRIKPRLGDVILDSFPVAYYDVLLCTVLLSHYTPEMTHAQFNPVPRVMRKLSDSVKPGGYMFNSQLYDMACSAEWHLITISKALVATIHNTSAGLLQKK